MKKCICIKDWKGYKVGDEAFYLSGRQWFLGGITISIMEFKEHFKAL